MVHYFIYKNDLQLTPNYAHLHRMVLNIHYQNIHTFILLQKNSSIFTSVLNTVTFVISSCILHKNDVISLWIHEHDVISSCFCHKNDVFSLCILHEHESECSHFNLHNLYNYFSLIYLNLYINVNIFCALKKQSFFPKQF